MAVYIDTNKASASIPWIWNTVLVTKVKVTADEFNGLDKKTWAPKSLQMVTAAMKLRDACSLKGKL